MKVAIPEAFIYALKKLPLNRQKKVIATIGKFEREPKLPSLDFRPLKGSDYHYIIDATGGDRIILRKVAEDEYEAVDAGTHDLYRRWNR